MNRPEYITCIIRATNPYKPWCGRDGIGRTFISLDHAAANGEKQGRLVACKECTTAAIKALTEGQE